jgi:hypothetical protein
MRVGKPVTWHPHPRPGGRIGITVGIGCPSFPRLPSQSIPARVWFMRRDEREVRVIAAGIHDVFSGRMEKNNFRIVKEVEIHGTSYLLLVFRPNRIFLLWMDNKKKNSPKNRILMHGSVPADG